jgi:hypothetical protein
MGHHKAISPIVIGLILVVVVVTGAILGYVFLFGLQEGFNVNPTGVDAVIDPTLYSTDAKVGVYGQPSNVSIFLSNTLSTVQSGVITITQNGRIVQNTTFILRPSETATTVIPQVLNATGVWAVKVTVRGVNVNSYYFEVVSSRDEADFAIRQWRDQNNYRNLVTAAFFLACISVIVSAASLARKPRTVIQSTAQLQFCSCSLFIGAVGSIV